LTHDDAPLPPSSTSGVIHDKELARRQRDKERKRDLRLTHGQREQENAQRRTNYRDRMDNGRIDLERKNLNQREWRMQHRESMTADEKGESSAQRKAKYVAKKNTPCAESIAMQRPCLDGTLSSSLAAPEFQTEPVCLDGGPAMTMPTYTVGTDGRNCLMSLSGTESQVVQSFAHHLNYVAADMESFLSGVMGEHPMPPDFMDEEYYLFCGQGMVKD
jgi:hypothetical protein